MRASAFLAVAVLAFAEVANAEGDLHAAVGAGAGVSEWDGDGVIPYGSALVGYRFAHQIGPVAYGREGYAKVDQRVLTLIGFGAQGWLLLDGWQPWLRIAWAHQHEEFIQFAKDEPFGVLFGVGRGIRHRGGFTFGAGVDVPFAHSASKKLEWFAGGEAFFDWLFAGEAPGPTYYVGGQAIIGMSFTL